MCARRAFACIAIAMGLTAGCGKYSSPTGPTVGGPPALVMTALTITGNGALTAPGQTSQLSAEATLPDGSKKDATSITHWASLNHSVATVSPSGLVTAVDFGKTTVLASTAQKFPTGAVDVQQASPFTITVLPEGTYILSGRVTEAGDFPLADVRIEIIGGPMSGRVVMTDLDGAYTFKGVAGVLQVRATRDGYVTATQNVSADIDHVNVELAPTLPYAAVGGVYSLTFKSAASCQLPQDAVSRTYTATIDQVGARLTITLADTQFWMSGGLTRNRLFGRMSGNTVSFTLADDDEGGSLVEKLASMRYLTFYGTAEATVTEPIVAAFNGTVRVVTSPDDPSLLKEIARCFASDHQLVFARRVATSRKRF